MRMQLMAVVVSIVLSAGTLASAADADYSCGCLELDSGGRFTVGFAQALVPMMTSEFEFGVGQPGLAFSAWVEVADFTSPSITAGARASLVRDWLSVSLLSDHSAASLGMSVLADVAPPSWLLVNASPSIAAAVSAQITAPVLGRALPPEVRATPSMIVIAPVQDSLLSCALSADLQLDPDTASIRIPSTTLAATYALGPTTLSASIGFAGAMTRIASTRLTLGIPDWGLEVSANLTPSGFGSLFYGVTISLQWGDSYLLPPKASEAGSSSCPGGICY